MIFRFRVLFVQDGPVICRLFDWVAKWFRANGAALRGSLIWPTALRHLLNVLLGVVATKLISATHYIWAGLAVGMILAPFDYLFLMIYAGFSLVLSRFVRVPGEGLRHRLDVGLQLAGCARRTGASDDFVQLDDVDHPHSGYRAGLSVAVWHRHPACATRGGGDRCQRLTLLSSIAAGSGAASQTGAAGRLIQRASSFSSPEAPSPCFGRSHGYV